jgi:hypothetical protein
MIRNVLTIINTTGMVAFMPIRTRPRWRALAACVAIGVALGPITACSRPLPRPVATPAATPASVPAALTAAEAGALASTEDVLTGLCMQSLGFRYWDSDYVVPPVAIAFPYVLDDLAWARAHGYNSGFTATVAAARTTNANSRYVLSLSPSRQADYAVALNGGGPGDPGVTLALPDDSGGVGHGLSGCSVRADEQMYGDFSTWFTASRLVNFYQPQVVQAVLADPRYIAAVAAWSSCMAGRGTPYASPAAAHAAFAGPAVPKTAEIAVATNEAECATSTDLDSIARAAEGRAIARLGDRGPWAYATERTLQHHALAVSINRA